MDDVLFDQLKQRIGFSLADAENVHALGRVLGDALPSISDTFHYWVVGDPSARAVFTGDEAQIERQRRAFTRWLGELFTGGYDADYFRRRIEIGRVHVRVGLPQHHMFTAMEMVWQEMRTAAAAKRADLPEIDDKLCSLHKLLTLETTVMLESYKEQYAARVREEERTAAEEQLTRSEHLAQIGQLAASLAHEIKNPLAGISGAIQVLRDQMDPADPRQPVIREILAQIGRLDATVKDLLVYSRPRPPEYRPCDLPATVNRVLKLIGDATALRSVPMSLHVEPQVPPVPVDVRQIEQVIMNLLFNAAHACKAGGTIRIHVSAAERRVILEVIDSGIGMTDEVAAKAFEPFYTTKARGTGLGLPICKKIVEGHGGTINLRSEPGLGTTVRVELPQVWA